MHLRKDLCLSDCVFRYLLGKQSGPRGAQSWMGDVKIGMMPGTMSTVCNRARRRKASVRQARDELPMALSLGVINFGL